MSRVNIQVMEGNVKFLIGVSILIFGLPPAWASNNLNHLSCIYFHDQKGWYFYSSQSNGSKFNLSKDGQRDMVGAWTSERPAPNYAICTKMVGTDSDEVVNIKSEKYQAKVITVIGAGCSVSGTDVNLVSDGISSVARGSFSELESDWLVLPSPDKIKVKTYFPTEDEIENLDQIAQKKCLELMP
jgi:hypothetical protein